MQGGSPLCRCRGSQHEGAIAVVEETMLKMAEVDIVVVGLPC
jgi:hypothetical protein